MVDGRNTGRDVLGFALAQAYERLWRRSFFTSTTAGKSRLTSGMPPPKRGIETLLASSLLAGAPAADYAETRSGSGQMRLRPLFAGAILAAGILPAHPGSADEFKNPPILEVRAPGDNLTIRARRGTASIPGLGEVEQVYGYDVRRGTTFPPERPGPKTVQLMPPVIAIDRGSALRILYRNELLTTDV